MYFTLTIKSINSYIPSAQNALSLVVKLRNNSFIRYDLGENSVDIQKYLFHCQLVADQTPSVSRLRYQVLSLTTQTRTITYSFIHRHIRIHSQATRKLFFRLESFSFEKLPMISFLSCNCLINEQARSAAQI